MILIHAISVGPGVGVGAGRCLCFKTSSPGQWRNPALAEVFVASVSFII